MFRNRDHAAHLLADRLSRYRGQHPLVLAIPRGAVPMGKVIADALKGDLDVVLVKKLRAPENPELAIGSIDDAGAVYLDPQLQPLWDEVYLEAEKARQLTLLRQRRAAYDRIGPVIDVAGRVVIVCDDGIATGATMIAALRAVRSRRPARLVVATAVAAEETVTRLAAEADEVVCLETPRALYAIGAHFEDFSQVSDEEVLALLKEARR